MPLYAEQGGGKGPAQSPSSMQNWVICAELGRPDCELFAEVANPAWRLVAYVETDLPTRSRRLLRPDPRC